MLEPHNIYHIHHRMYTFHYFGEKDTIASSRIPSANSPNILLHITQKKSKSQPSKALVPEDTKGSGSHPVLPSWEHRTASACCAPAGTQLCQSSWPGEHSPAPPMQHKGPGPGPAPAPAPAPLPGHTQGSCAFPSTQSTWYEYQQLRDLPCMADEPI